MSPNYRQDTDYQRWLASQGRRPADDSIPRYGPYENDPYEPYDGEDVRPDNVASYEAMHKPGNSLSHNHNDPSLNPDSSLQTTYRTWIPDTAVYYFLLVALLLVIRYVWRSQQQSGESASKEQSATGKADATGRKKF